MLATFVATLAGCVLLLALAAIWQSLRTAFGAAAIDPRYGARASRSHEALEDEKAAIFRALKDIADEHALGKLAEDDFRRLDTEYRVRAREVLRALDEEVADYRERAQKIVLERVAKVVREESERKTADEKTEAQAAKRNVKECSACKAQNDLDALFCKKCAARLGGEPSVKEDA